MVFQDLENSVSRELMKRVASCFVEKDKHSGGKFVTGFKQSW
ncbi:hypothetical protein BARBAKC583_0170 [Bartonella bacilliformis KC583]|uniref:Uncharacterized protein n=1 Tax=Bartonella bacilliformis (strain ATCC 35685 / KC583 / Herrer 020/F12,63) TaxID=360095 RepID=A1URA5_BARBK|nr:hypothetical protein BARBAKC583_0170 [Bartonella bacilliformis KC583]